MKNKKKMRGQPIDYDELKIKRSVCVTDTAWANLKEKASLAGVSVSELIELFARDRINQ